MSANRVSDLTIDEFKDLIRETVREVLREQEQDDYDPDDGLELRPEIVKRLRDFEETPLDQQQFFDLDDVAKEMGLDA